MMGLSTSGSISFGWALVAGRKRVPNPAAGKIALRTFWTLRRLLFIRRSSLVISRQSLVVGRSRFGLASAETRDSHQGTALAMPDSYRGIALAIPYVLRNQKPL